MIKYSFIFKDRSTYDFEIPYEFAKENFGGLQKLNNVINQSLTGDEPDCVTLSDGNKLAMIRISDVSLVEIKEEEL